FCVFFSSIRRHTICYRDWSSDVCSSDLSFFSIQFAGEVKNFDPLNWIEKKELKKVGRFIQVALAAADFAVKMAGLEVTPEIADEIGRASCRERGKVCGETGEHGRQKQKA